CLEVPHALPGAGVETDDRLGEEIMAESCAAVPVVARRADRQIHESASIIDAERSPHVRVTGGLPRIVEPRLGAFVLRAAWDGAEVPFTLARLDVERLHVAGRIVRVDQLVGHTVTDDHQIVPYH